VGNLVVEEPLADTDEAIEPALELVADAPDDDELKPGVAEFAVSAGVPEGPEEEDPNERAGVLNLADVGPLKADVKMADAALEDPLELIVNEGVEGPGVLEDPLVLTISAGVEGPGDSTGVLSLEVEVVAPEKGVPPDGLLDTDKTAEVSAGVEAPDSKGVDPPGELELVVSVLGLVGVGRRDAVLAAVVLAGAGVGLRDAVDEAMAQEIYSIKLLISRSFTMNFKLSNFYMKPFNLMKSLSSC
jgi:hypothetical protein